MSRYPHKPRAHAPQFFLRLVTEFLQAPLPLAQELWHTYQHTYSQEWRALAFNLDQLLAPIHGNEHAGLMERFQKASALITPALLLDLTARVSPESRSPRRPDIISLEESLMRHIDHTGAWV